MILQQLVLLDPRALRRSRGLALQEGAPREDTSHEVRGPTGRRVGEALKVELGVHVERCVIERLQPSLRRTVASCPQMSIAGRRLGHAGRRWPPARPAGRAREVVEPIATRLMAALPSLEPFHGHRWTTRGLRGQAGCQCRVIVRKGERAETAVPYRKSNGGLASL